ncbi:MAG: Uma2 family endonuclease [Terriglobales bacterium]|jgi:Uma2 family endonuclease
MATRTLITLEDFDRLPDEEGVAYELDEGELIMMPPPAIIHNLLRERIASEVRDFAEKRNLGKVLWEAAFLLSENTVRIPDAAFVSAERMKSLDVHQSRIPGAPDLAIEVVSLSNLAEDLARKIDQYFVAGATAIWVIYQRMREVHVFEGTRTGHILAECDSLELPGLLPGFSVPVQSLFSL